METKLSETCSAPDFFAGLDPSLSAREARALILAAYSEKELAPERAESVRSHLETCSACASFLSDFERSTVPEVACAICPSSELLDRFIFDRQSVPAVEAGRIEAHLRECSLCRSECQWLKHLESAGTTSFRQPAPTWMRPALAAAAVVIIALAAILYSRGAEQTPNSGQLKALAVIKEPAQIDFAELERTSGTPDPATAALYREAVTEFKDGHFQEASGKLEEVIRRSPGHSGAFYLLGYSYYKMNRPQKAFELCDRAEGMSPHAYERCMFLVNIALKTGNFQRAFTEISALYHDAPQVPEIRDLYLKMSALMPERTSL